MGAENLFFALLLHLKSVTIYYKQLLEAIMELTNEQKLYAKKIKSPNFVYNVLGWVWKTFVYKKYK